MRRALASGMLLCCFVGCAQAPHTVTARRPAPHPDQAATLTVYRAYAVPTKVNARIYVDGVQVATLPDMMYSSAKVEPGSHVITVDFPFLAGMKETRVSGAFEANRTYYIQYEGVGPHSRPVFGPGGRRIGSLDADGSIRNKLSIVPEELAEPIVRSGALTYAPPLSEAK